MSCPDRSIAVCQHPMGDGHYVAAEDIRDGRCFEGGCDCTPRVYVAVDALKVALLEEQARGTRTSWGTWAIGVMDRLAVSSEQA